MVNFGVHPGELPSTAGYKGKASLSKVKAGRDTSQKSLYNARLDHVTRANSLQFYWSPVS